MLLTHTDISRLSYDGDDATAPTTLVSSNNIAPNQKLPQQSLSAPEEEEPDSTYVPPSFEPIESHQINGRDAQNGAAGFNGGHVPDRDDVSMNNEPFGSGIKEDG